MSRRMNPEGRKRFLSFTIVLNTLAIVLAGCGDFDTDGLQTPDGTIAFPAPDAALYVTPEQMGELKTPTPDGGYNPALETPTPEAEEVPVARTPTP